MVGFPLRLSHAHARLRPRKHLKRRRSVMERRTHPHAQFSASIVISMSGTPIRSDIVRALPGLWCRRLDSNQRLEPDICLAPLYPTELRLRSSPARTAREMPGSLHRIDRHSSCLRGGAYINLNGSLRRWGGGSPSAILSMRPVSRLCLGVPHAGCAGKTYKMQPFPLRNTP